MRLINISKEWVFDDCKIEHIVSGDIRIYTYSHLNGGGSWMADFFAKIVDDKSTKKIYDYGFEWCAGFGLLGFDALGRGKCNHITFSDYYNVAINSCILTAKENNIADRVKGFVSSTIEGIPKTEVWDLVIANPPHSFGSIDESIKSLIDQGLSKTALNNVLRMILDEDFKIHKEFFTNIRSHLTIDADVFLYEPSYCADYIKSQEQFINDCGLEIFESYSINEYLDKIPKHIPDFTHRDGQLMHFKVKK